MVQITSESRQADKQSSGYWRSSLRVVFFILAIWAFVSLGCGILLRDWLDTVMPNIGGAPFGFWMAQQGSIICFLVLLAMYMLLMNRLDRKHGYDEVDSAFTPNASAKRERSS